MNDKFVWHPSWAERFKYRTWEINWPGKSVNPWPEELIGIMDFEAEEWLRDIQSCH